MNNVITYAHLPTKFITRLIVSVVLTIIGVSGSAYAQSVDWLVQIDDVGFDPIAAGGDIEYSIGVSNYGYNSAPATTIVISLPLNAELIGTSGSIANCTSPTTIGPVDVTCDVPALADGDSAFLELVVRTSVADALIVVASVSTVGDDNVNNNSEPEETTVVAGSDLGVVLSVPATVASGSYVDLVYTVTNYGPNTATSFQLFVPVPAGLSNITPPAGCTLSGGNYTCTVNGSLPVGNSVPLIFNGQIFVPGGSTVTPTGSVINADPEDPISANNQDSANINVTGGSDVSIVKTHTPSGPLLVGDSVTFNISSSYTGDVPLNLVVQDNVPSNYAISSVVAPDWSCTTTGQLVECNRPSGTIAGANISLGSIVINTTIVSDGTPTNTATITSTAPVDPNPGNNSDSDGGATISIPVVDIMVTKTGPSPALGVVGNDYQYRLNARNIGNTNFTGTLVMTDTVPVGVTINSVFLNEWSCATIPAVGPVDVVCSRDYTVGSPLPANTTTPNVVFNFEFTQAGTITNNVDVSLVDANYPDNNVSNDTDSQETEVVLGSNAADIRVAKSAALASVVAGDIQTFELEIINDGPVASLDVEVRDNLTDLMNNNVGATGAGFVSYSINSGSASGITCSTSSSGSRSRRLSCDIITLPVCTANSDCPVITVQVRPGRNAGNRTNTVTVESQTTPDPDLDNDEDSVSYDVTARADMTVTKTANPDPVAAGQNLTYVVSARNSPNGLSRADNVVITDTLPDSLTFISATPSTGTCGTTPAVGSVTTAINNQVVCSLGNINNGSQQTVTIVVRPNNITLNTTITNNVSVVTTTPETDLTNNSASVDVSVQPPNLDLLVNKSDTVDPVIIYEDTVYVITVTNAGASASENVVVTDNMPDNLFTYQSHTISGGGTCSQVPNVGDLNGTLVCTWPYMEVGSSETIEITAKGIAKGSDQNNVSISSDEIIAGFDRLEPNNHTSEITTVRTKTDIEVTSKTPSSPTVNLNDNFDFVAVVHVNTGTGLQEADDVVFSDSLPAGMVLTGPPVATVTAGAASVTSCTGAAGDVAFTCDLGTVTSNSTVEITMPVEVVTVTQGAQPVVNTASVTTTSFDIDLDNNENTGSVTVNSSTIAGTVFRDFADDYDITTGDTFIGGVTMTLSGTSFDNKPVSASTTTNASGDFLFEHLPAGTYTVTRGTVSEPYLVNGTNTEGSVGGVVVSATVINAIALPADTDAITYLFPLIPQARVGIAKTVQVAETTNPDGSFNTTFRLLIENFSLEALDNMEVTDTLAGGAPLFGSYQALATPATDALNFGQYTLLSAPTGTCSGLSAGFNGSSNTVVATGFTLASEATCTIDIAMRIRPTNPLPPVLSSGGRYENQASVTGEGVLTGQTPATNPELSDDSDNGTNPDPNGNGRASDTNEGDPTPVIPTISPSIALIKTGSNSGFSSPPTVGDTITYAFRIENTGNVTLTNILLSDDLTGIVLSGGPITSLVPGGVDSTTFTATYDLTQGDIDAGEVENTATTTGTDPYGTDVEDDSGSTNNNDTPTVVSIDRVPSITLVKTADTSDFQSPPYAGDEIAYAFRIENTGNVTLTNVTLADALNGIVLTGSSIASMAPGDVNTTAYSAIYTLTLADMANGYVINTADVTGTPPSGPDVTDDSGVTVGDDDPTETTILQAPALALEKFVDQDPHLDGSEVGDLVEYTFTVTNTGNIPLNLVDIDDALVDAVVSGGPISVLNPGVADSTTFTATYYIKAADITAGEVINDATVTGYYGPTNNEDVTDDDTVRLLVGKIEAISEVYPAFTTDGGTTTSMLASDLLNGSPALLTTVSITVLSSDPEVTLDPLTGLITLAPGHPAGPYVVEYEICSLDIPTMCDSTIETVTQGALPGVEVTKTQIFTDDGDGLDGVNDIVTYTIIVENTGNVPLEDVSLVDTLTDLNTLGLTLDALPQFVSASDGSGEGDLVIDETAEYTATFTLNLQAVNAFGISNTVTGSGLPVYGLGVPGTPERIEDVSDNGIDTDGNTEDDPTILPFQPAVVPFNVILTKTTPDELVLRGGTVPYTITIVNENTYVAGPMDIVDTLPVGFIYVPGTATFEGASATVIVDNAVITWPAITVPAAGQVVVTLQARILTGADAAYHVNRVNLRDTVTGLDVVDPETAIVRILPEAVFDCGDVIGKVYDDRNGNGYQDDVGSVENTGAVSDQNYYGGKGKLETAVSPDNFEENGIPNARLMTVDGLVITTDEYGRFSVPCAMLPSDSGSNFILKLDTRSLPNGFMVTTENPRVSRLTQGVMTEMNFGATLGHVARVDINDTAFDAEGQPVPALNEGLRTLAQSLVGIPSTVSIVYHVDSQASAPEVTQARIRMGQIRDALLHIWRDVGDGPLDVKVSIIRAAE